MTKYKREEKMLEIGKINKLVVNRETKSGYYLQLLDGDEEVFMPPALSPFNVKIGDRIDAFVYMDTKGELVASSEIPFAEVGEFAFLRVIEKEDFGCFMDWGISKDLLVPGNEQKVKMQKYEDYIVRVCLDEKTNRVFGTTKFGVYIEQTEFDITEGDHIDFIPCYRNEIGFQVIANKKYLGMIYHNEIYQNIALGKSYSGIVKKIREDNRIDISLQKIGVSNLHDVKNKILEYLDNHSGNLPVHDKSTPEDIKRVLGVSKKSFKAAIGMLYKERIIEIKDKKVTLIKNK